MNHMNNYSKPIWTGVNDYVQAASSHVVNARRLYKRVSQKLGDSVAIFASLQHCEVIRVNNPLNTNIIATNEDIPSVGRKVCSVF